MLHSTKRVLLRPLHLSAPLDEDVAAWQQKLANVSAALSAASASLVAQRRDWARLFTTADTFASDLHTLYPNDDDVRALGKRSRTATAGLLAGLAAVDGPAVLGGNGSGGGGGGGGGGGAAAGAPPAASAPLAVTAAAASAAGMRAASAAEAAAAAHRTVKAYLAEIETLTREYPKVAAARRDVEAYERKVEALLGKRRVDEAKVARNEDKKDVCEQTYVTLKEALLERMRGTYAKHPGVFKAAFAGFFCSWEECKERSEAALGDLGGVARALARRGGGA